MCIVVLDSFWLVVRECWLVACRAGTYVRENLLLAHTQSTSSSASSYWVFLLFNSREGRECYVWSTFLVS